MAIRETFYLPSVTLDVDFAGDESAAYDLKAFRSAFKDRLTKRLITEGVAFQERSVAAAGSWRGEEDAVSRLEGAVDAWVLENKYPCSKSRDKHSRKARWTLECEEPVTILMMPVEG